MVKSMSAPLAEEDSEHRQQIRWKTILWCTFQKGRKIFYGEVIDLSLGGIFVKSEAEVAVQDQLIMEIHVPASGSIQLLGSVRYVGRFLAEDGSLRGFGVRFERIRKADVPKLLQLAKLATNPAEAKRVLEVHAEGLSFY